MSYWRLYYHLVWATKQRLPLIKPELEAKLHGYFLNESLMGETPKTALVRIIGKADYLGCITHAINGTENHIHVVASIPPSLSISQYVKKIKGSSSHYWNHTLAYDSEKFYWQEARRAVARVSRVEATEQEGYGIFSLGSKQLETAVNYLKNQKIHYSRGTVMSSTSFAIALLERHGDVLDTSTS